MQNQGIESIDDNEFYVLCNEMDEQSKFESQSLIQIKLYYTNFIQQVKFK